MKIAITARRSEAPVAEWQVDPRFGRAGCFVLWDSEKGDGEVVDNTPNLNAAQGAGIQAAELAARVGAQAVLTGHCGPKAFRALAAAEIPVVVGVEGTVREAADAFLAGRLTPAASADVEGHW